MSAENISYCGIVVFNSLSPSGCFLEKIRNIPQDSIYIFCKLGNWANDIEVEERGGEKL